MREEEFRLPEKCPLCHTTPLPFVPTKAGDITCSKCGGVIAKWYDWIETNLPADY